MLKKVTFNEPHRRVEIAKEGNSFCISTAYEIDKGEIKTRVFVSRFIYLV